MIRMIDAVEVVRCRDCVHYWKDYWANIDGVPVIAAHDICDFWGRGCKTDPDAFCSHGKRKEEKEWQE